MYSWKIWYENEIITGTTIQEWIDAPSEGVLGVVQHKELYKGHKSASVHSGGDWYWMLPNGVVQNTSDSTYTIDYWVPCPAPPEAITKKGKWTANENMLQVSKEMIEEVKNG